MDEEKLNQAINLRREIIQLDNLINRYFKPAYCKIKPCELNEVFELFKLHPGAEKEIYQIIKNDIIRQHENLVGRFKLL